jgi:hypothetical protein
MPIARSGGLALSAVGWISVIACFAWLTRTRARELPRS